MEGNAPGKESVLAASASVVPSVARTLPEDKIEDDGDGDNNHDDCRPEQETSPFAACGEVCPGPGSFVLSVGSRAILSIRWDLLTGHGSPFLHMDRVTGSSFDPIATAVSGTPRTGRTSHLNHVRPALAWAVDTACVGYL